MHHSEGIISEHQSNSSSVTVESANLAAHHYQHSHQQPPSQHVGLMPSQTKADNIDYNLHRVNDSSMYNQMVMNEATWKLQKVLTMISCHIAICIFRSKRTIIQPEWDPSSQLESARNGHSCTKQSIDE